MTVDDGIRIIDTVFIWLRCLNWVENLKAYDVVQYDTCQKCSVTIPCSLFYKLNTTTWIWEEYTPLPTDVISDEACVLNPTYDYEKELLCEKVTWKKVLVESRVDVNDPIQARQWRITYLVWWAIFAWDPESDLENCADTDIESDPQTMCDGGTTFMRWYEKSNGLPTTNFFDRTIDYAVYVPVWVVTPWPCMSSSVSTIDSYSNVWNWTYTSITPSKEVQIRYDTYKNWFIPAVWDVTILVAWAMTGNKTYTIVPNTSRTIQLATNDIVSVTISWAVNNTLEVLFIN